jgi:hypothetical protein
MEGAGSRREKRRKEERVREEGGWGRRRYEGDPISYNFRARLARVGGLVLFLGSGVSSSAGLPNWGDLLAELAKKGGMFLLF